MKSNVKIKVLFSKEVDVFLEGIPASARAKIVQNVEKVSDGFMEKELFKKLDGTDIWEFRTLYQKTAYRLLAFWDTEGETLVLATHGFLKKTQKTPHKEIAKAEAARKAYFESKKKRR